MAKQSRAKAASAYRSVGKTYDGVRVLAPKTKSKTFTAAEVRRAIEKALSDISGSKTKAALRDSEQAA